MALDKTTLINTLTSIFNDLTTANNTASAKATAIANAIDTYVKSGSVTVASGIPVSTTGTAAAQTGSTTGTGTGTIS